MRRIKNPKLKIKSFLTVFTVCIMSFAIASVVFASGGEESHTPLWKDYLWKIINFGILVIILYVFARKPLQSFLKNRSETIEKTLKEAKDAKELAKKALAEVEEKLKLKDKEIEQILSAAKRSGEEDRERIINESYILKEKILEQAKTNIEYEVKHAKEAIKAEAVELAMELAEKKLKEKLTKAEQEKLLEDSLAKIGGKG
ncbi:MAG: F0F1 ATP synthase subunit B [Nitrospirota bacterium]